MAALWAGTVKVLLSYWLVRVVWPALMPLAVLEGLLGLRPGKLDGARQNP